MIAGCRLRTVVVSVIGLLLVSGAFGDESPSIPAKATDVTIIGEVGYLEDPLQNRPLEDVVEHPQQFTPFPLFTYDLQANEIVVWIRISVANAGSEERRLFLDATKGHFWKADFYVTDAGDRLSTLQYNAARPEHFASELTGSVAFPFSVPAKSERLLFLRLKTYDIRGVGLAVRSEEDQLARLGLDRALTGLMLGIIVGLFLYNVVLFASIRVTSYHYFLGFLLFAIPYLLSVKRLGIGVITHVVPLDALSLSALFAMAALVFVALFTRSFLQTRDTMPVIHVALTGLIIAGPVSTVANFVVPDLLGGIDGAVMFAALIVMTIAGVVGMVRRQRDAYTYSLSLFVFLAGAVLSFLYDLGVRPYGLTFLFSDAVQYGVVLCALLLSVSVSLRIRQLYVERARLADLNRAKSDLLAAVSHELRTPLANLWLLIDRVQRYPPDYPLHSTDPMFTAMRRQADRLGAHVENLLLHSRLELFKNSPQLHPESVGPLVASYVGEFTPRALQLGIRLSCLGADVTDNVDVDAVLFGSAIGNLLDNALRLTPSGGAVDVEVGPVPGHADRIAVSVSDTGPGVPEEAWDTLFEPGTVARSGGLGLGLSLARQIVELHGGHIAHVPAETGARFLIVLPVATPSPAPVADAEVPEGTHDETTPSTDTFKPTVLVVDDDADLRANLLALLSERFRVITAGTAREADLRLAAGAVDAIVSDVMMPGEDGFAWYRRLRSDGDGAAIPFLFLTARADQESELRGLNLGAVDYVRKPFRSTVLLAKLTSLIRARHAAAEHLRSTLLEHIGRWPGYEEVAVSEEQSVSVETKTVAVGSAESGSGEPSVDLDAAQANYGFTGRQIEVLRLVIKGYTNREIADLLNVSVKTVNYHVSAILRRVGVDRRTQLSHELSDSPRES